MFLRFPFEGDKSQRIDHGPFLASRSLYRTKTGLAVLIRNAYSQQFYIRIPDLLMEAYSLDSKLDATRAGQEWARMGKCR